MQFGNISKRFSVQFYHCLPLRSNAGRCRSVVSISVNWLGDCGGTSVDGMISPSSCIKAPPTAISATSLELRARAKTRTPASVKPAAPSSTNLDRDLRWIPESPGVERHPR